MSILRKKIIYYRLGGQKCLQTGFGKLLKKEFSICRRGKEPVQEGGFFLGCHWPNWQILD